MQNKVSCRKKTVFSRRLEPFKSQESQEVKEYGNGCCQVKKKALFTGFSEIAKSQKCRRLAIKVFVFFLCTSGFIYQTWTFLQMYLSYPTTLDISEEYPDSFIAPAITMCNRNRIWRQPYCKAFPEKCTWQHTTWESFCDAYKRMCPKTKPPDFNFGIPEFEFDLRLNRSNDILDVAGPELHTNVVLFHVSGASRMNLSTVYIEFPKNGYKYRCSSFFSLLGNQNKETLILTLADRYTVVFDMHPEEYFNTFDLVEASIVLHDPRKTVNPFTEGITLTSGNMYQLYPTIERRESLPPPYAPKCRDYLTEWKNFGGYGPLSKDDCINQCKINENVRRYGCLGQTMSYASYYLYPICGDPSYETSTEDHRIFTSLCADACEENLYHFTTDIVQDITGMCNDTDEYCKSRYLFIHVNFNRMKIKKFKQIPRFESIELFSYIGGYLGLWLGISLASVFDLAEMIYDVIYTAFLKRKTNRKRTTPIEQFQHHTTVKKKKIL